MRESAARPYAHPERQELLLKLPGSGLTRRHKSERNHAALTLSAQTVDPYKGRSHSDVIKQTNDKRHETNKEQEKINTEAGKKGGGSEEEVGRVPGRRKTLPVRTAASTRAFVENPVNVFSFLKKFYVFIFNKYLFLNIYF